MFLSVELAVKIRELQYLPLCRCSLKYEKFNFSTLQPLTGQSYVQVSALGLQIYASQSHLLLSLVSTCKFSPLIFSLPEQ